MNNKIKNIALEVGGSHYPDVGGQLLEKFAETIVKRCAHIAHLYDDSNLIRDAILREFEFDRD